MTSALAALLALWVLLGAVWVAVWPLFGGDRGTAGDEEAARAELETEKARLLGEIHELELDYETGKLSDEDFRALEARLKARAVEVMREIDERKAAGLERRSRAAKRKRQRAKAR